MTLDGTARISGSALPRLIADVLRPTPVHGTQTTAEPHPHQMDNLASAIAATNAAYASAGVTVSFSVVAPHGATRVMVSDTITGEVLRHMPPDDMLALASAVQRIDSLMASYTGPGANGPSLNASA